jgi:hypothetical protein
MRGSTANVKEILLVILTQLQDFTPHDYEKVVFGMPSLGLYEESCSYFVFRSSSIIRRCPVNIVACSTIAMQ